MRTDGAPCAVERRPYVVASRAVGRYFLHGVELRGLELLTLVPILLGVLLATAAELSVNFTGTFFAVSGLLSTSFYQAPMLGAWEMGVRHCQSRQYLLQGSHIIEYVTKF